jgi:DNA-binding transcriptional regulator YiaG
MTGEQLETSLKAALISRKDFAILIDVSYRTVNRWINNEVPVPKTVSLLVKMLTPKK